MPLAHTQIAFKGPSDHLSQFFEPATIYQGLLLLLSPVAPEDDEFAEVSYFEDWYFDREEKIVSAICDFSHEQDKQQQLELSLSWPLDLSNRKSNSFDCSCGQAPSCVHLAALAVESKMRLDRLPTSLKDAQAALPSWSAFLGWHQQQTHDPYPNMARHRLAYILDIEGDDCIFKVQKAYLTKTNEYQNKAEFDLQLVARNADSLEPSKPKKPKALQKFVSLVDQQILQLIQKLNLSEQLKVLSDSSFSLPINQAYQLLKLTQSCQRLFWKACFRPPLSWKQQSIQQADQLTTSDNPLIAINTELSFNKSSNGFVQTIQPNQELLKSLAAIKTLPLGRFVQTQLSIQSQQIDLRAFSQPPLKINYARPTIIFNKKHYDFEEIIEQQHYLSQSANGLKLLQHVARVNHKLNWLPSIQSQFELPITEHFNSGDRFLESDISHWAPLIPALHALDWQIDFANSFYLNHLEADDWYINVEDSQQDWFSLELGVTLNSFSSNSEPSNSAPSNSEHGENFAENLKQQVNLLPYLVKAFHNGADSYEQIEKQLAVNNHQLSIQLDSGENILVAKSKVKHIFSILLELLEKAPLNQQHKLELPQVQVNRLAQFSSELSLSEMPTGEAGEKTDINFKWLGDQELKEKALKLNNIQQIEHITPTKTLNAELRHYQQEGLNWLQFLSQNQLGGILADDMGLGKTLQTLAHILTEKESGRMQSPCLIVVPTSLINNWQSEAERFAPTLKVLILAGNKRHQHYELLPDGSLHEQHLEAFDLVILSYGTLQRDLALLQATNFHLLILDEAQAIKNARSKITQQVCKINAKLRLCLTGTPMENHLGELWSLFNFLMPEFLGSRPQFQRLYQEPIEKQQDFVRQQELAQRISPFMLRRTKDKVAKELPKKVEINQVIELEAEQAELYETIRLSMSNEIQKIVQDDNGKANQLLISNALLRLRQICCHPQLTPFEAAQNNHASAKLTWIKNQLPIMIEEGRKVLLFSSFTSMLDIISDELEALNIKHLMLTGKSQKRGELIESFQNNDIPVFLISLKAGGSGLNLTAADTVIHYDPWWNPAAEQQASDRAHRIGQDKPVFVYKLISKDTVEQRILQLQQRKEQLATKLYQSNAEQKLAMADINWQELLKPLNG